MFCLQHSLETGLLALGQLHHAITEFLAWLNATENELDSKPTVVYTSPKQIEIEIAKHKVGGARWRTRDYMSDNDTLNT